MRGQEYPDSKISPQSFRLRRARFEFGDTGNCNSWSIQGALDLVSRLLSTCFEPGVGDTEVNVMECDPCLQSLTVK